MKINKNHEKLVIVVITSNSRKNSSTSMALCGFICFLLAFLTCAMFSEQRTTEWPRSLTYRQYSPSMQEVSVTNFNQHIDDLKTIRDYIEGFLGFMQLFIGFLLAFYWLFIGFIGFLGLLGLLGLRLTADG